LQPSLDARRKYSLFVGDDLTAGEMPDRFAMSKPAISKHLQILENAGPCAARRAASS